MGSCHQRLEALREGGGGPNRARGSSGGAVSVGNDEVRENRLQNCTKILVRDFLLLVVIFSRKNGFHSVIWQYTTIPTKQPLLAKVSHVCIITGAKQGQHTKSHACTLPQRAFPRPKRSIYPRLPPTPPTAPRHLSLSSRGTRRGERLARSCDPPQRWKLGAAFFSLPGAKRCARSRRASCATRHLALAIGFQTVAHAAKRECSLGWSAAVVFHSLNVRPT